MMYCSICGAPLQEGMRFCPGCGAPVPRVPELPGPAAPLAESPVRKRRKKRKGLLRRWWFWVLIVAAVIAVYNRNEVRRPSTAPIRTETAVTAAPMTTARPTQKPSPVPTPEPTAEPEVSAAAENEIRPEVKAFLDAYEACMNEYADFMQKYSSADSGSMVSMMSDYYRILTRYNEFAEKMDAWDESELNGAETAYYLAVMNRVNQRLLTVAEG